MTKENPKEKDVKAKVKALLDKHGWFYWMPSANVFGINGVSDILALKNGRLLAIETKLKKGSGSPLQERFGANVEANGGSYRVVNMMQIEDGSFAQWLNDLTYLIA